MRKPTLLQLTGFRISYPPSNQSRNCEYWFYWWYVIYKSIEETKRIASQVQWPLVTGRSDSTTLDIRWPWFWTCLVSHWAWIISSDIFHSSDMFQLLNIPIDWMGHSLQSSYVWGITYYVMLQCSRTLASCAYNCLLWATLHLALLSMK